MSDSQLPNLDDEPKYRIGAVCRLTGLSQHVLRVWEKRYGVVEPMRSETQRRLYNEGDVNRLSLLKTLVDRGQAIGSIANLDTAELTQRVKQSANTVPMPGNAEKPGLALFGEGFFATVEDCASSEVFTLVGKFDDTSDFTAQKTKARLDVAVIEWPSLQPETAIEVTRLANRLNARHENLFYDYAPRAELLRHKHDRITPLRSPLDIAALEAVVAWRFGFVAKSDDSLESIASPAAARLFNDRELAYLASQSSAIACECPTHLAELITRLLHFELYSAECESRSAEDAALHAYLHKTTSRARNMMERALVRVVELEKLSLLPDS
jgi:DNA-binding transcriptional MerR regulator